MNHLFKKRMKIFATMTGSGEIDIFEHHGDYDPDHFTTGAIKT